MTQESGKLLEVLGSLYVTLQLQLAREQQGVRSIGVKGELWEVTLQLQLFLFVINENKETPKRAMATDDLTK